MANGKSETCRDEEILVRNPSPRLFVKEFRDSKKVKTNHAIQPYAIQTVET